MKSSSQHKSGTITTGDGIQLAYDQYGNPTNPNIVFLSGWCQTALQWKKQYESLARDFCITTYDHRGHGDSEKTTRGFRISRHAADLNDILVQLNLQEATLVGHSMGCSVIWSHWDLFTESRSHIKSLVFVDQSPCMLSRPGWSEEMAKEIGTVFTDDSLKDFILTLQGPNPQTFLSQFVPAMFTSKVSSEDIKWTLERCSLMDPKSAATLALDHFKNDWRDVIETINVPTLVLAATGSICPVAALEWIASHVEGAQLVVIDKEDGGSHFMFWENPTKFNALLACFAEKGHVVD